MEGPNQETSTQETTKKEKRKMRLSEKKKSYHPKRAFSNGKTRAKEKLGDLRYKTFSILGAVVPQNMLSNCRVTNHNEISRSSSQPVNGSIHVHPFKQGKKQSSTKKISHVVKLSTRYRYIRLIALGYGQRLGQRSEPIWADP